jgi:four helix bundle protein
MHNSKKVSKLALSYYDLEVFNIAFKSAMIIYKLSKKWPIDERYSLTDQIRRASRSVCSNIAEAWRKRRYPAHFISKLSDADSEAAETEVWLRFASNCGYMEKTHFETLKDNYDHICRKLTIMMSNANKWKLNN